jgi:hypothetical protein
MTGNIGSNDVLCGRGGATNNHLGNKRFRAIVVEYQYEYLEAKKKEKAVIARQIVERIKKSGGRFLKRDATSDVWVEVTPKKATEKTSQALREGLDVRHKTIRPEKMHRRDSDSSCESPRKRARLVEGKVVEPPSLMGFGRVEQGNIPELNDERRSAPVNPMLVYFKPPSITQEDCEDTAAV